MYLVLSVQLYKASLSRSHARDIEVSCLRPNPSEHNVMQYCGFLSFTLFPYLHPKNLIGLDMSGMAMLCQRIVD